MSVREQLEFQLGQPLLLRPSLPRTLLANLASSPRRRDPVTALHPASSAIAGSPRRGRRPRDHAFDDPQHADVGEQLKVKLRQPPLGSPQRGTEAQLLGRLFRQLRERPKRCCRFGCPQLFYLVGWGGW